MYKNLKLYDKIFAQGVILFMGPGIIIIIFYSIMPLIITNAFKKVPNQKKVKGVIHSIEYDATKSLTSDNNQYHYYIQYIVNGKEYLIKTHYTSSITNVVGKKRYVKYNTNKPEQAIICPEITIYILAIIAFICGIYIIAYSFIPNDNNYNNNIIIKNNCCTCLDCPKCDVCCSCDNPYLNK